MTVCPKCQVEIQNTNCYTEEIFSRCVILKVKGFCPKCKRQYIYTTAAFTDWQSNDIRIQ